MASKSDGVHLGQEDLPLEPVRRLMKSGLVGISTHNLTQAKEAERGGADYIGFGPIFGTVTKETPYLPRGLPMLREIRTTIDIPIVAIGGITEDNVTRIWETGVDAAAMISELMGAKDIGEKARRILRLHQPSCASS